MWLLASSTIRASPNSKTGTTGEAAKSLRPTDVGQYLLTNFATIDEVRAALATISIVPVVEPALGFAAPEHFIVRSRRTQ